ncbi:hypothetical protein AV530_006163 [Patagioenas fasciata monilis]|uniref:Uncharacterized protein n=1 Tax=Patagioenas fasciata monilis TaxID=372326 RepID=A0A1V4J8F0_PATFA|nr:hypothetical protein AV530_006163 [Patagioenas fasciata monilis]
MPDYAAAKPQELASRKYTPEKKTFKALWKNEERPALEDKSLVTSFCFSKRNGNVQKRPLPDSTSYIEENQGQNFASSPAKRMMAIHKTNMGIILFAHVSTKLEIVSPLLVFIDL